MGSLRLVHSADTPPAPDGSCLEASARALDDLFGTLLRETATTSA